MAGAGRLPVTISFQTATAGDAAILAALFRQGFCDTFAHLYRPEDLADFLAQHGEDRWSEQLADPAFAVFVAEEEGGSAAGFAKIGPVRLPVTTTAAAVELSQFYVLGPWQGRGVASELMDLVFAEVRRRGAEELYLSVFTENDRARRFYARYGFEEVGPYRFMVGSHADEDIIMRLKL